jgi:hypothetical protein
MTSERSAQWAWGVVSGIASLLLGWLLFDYYRYYDYRPGECTPSGFVVRATLVGDWAELTTRSSPYSLVVELAHKDPVHLENVVLAASDGHGVSVPLSGAGGHERGLGTTIFSSVPLDLDYREWLLHAIVHDPSGSKTRISCIFRRAYRSEFRLRFMDILMSV